MSGTTPPDTPQPLFILTDERMIAHDPGPGHPERPDRLRAVIDAVRSERLQAPILTPKSVDLALIEAVHDPDYVQSVLRLEGQRAALDADTAVSPGSIPAALLAAGACADAVDLVQSGKTLRAFALVRPPGHHAEFDRAMGFCLFNNIAIAAQHAIEHHGIKRVLIVDWDVHHGNGTQHHFETRADVLYASMHEWPMYPGTGRAEEVGLDAGRGYTVNIPYAAGADDAAFLAAMHEVIIPIARAFRPELVLVSAGYDADARDPLASMRLTPDGFTAMTMALRDLADECCAGRTVFVLEGGYNLDALTEGVSRTLDALAGSNSSPVIDWPAASQAHARQRTASLLQPFWPSVSFGVNG